MKVIVLVLLFGSGTPTAAVQAAPGNTLRRLSMVGLPFAANCTKKGTSVGVGRAREAGADDAAGFEACGDEIPVGEAVWEPPVFVAWPPQPVATSTTTAKVVPSQALYTPLFPAPTCATR